MRSNARAHARRRFLSRRARLRKHSSRRSASPCAERRGRRRALASVDLETGEPGEALVERSDVSAVEALAVVGEAAVAWELARTAREKFGGDALGDFVAAHKSYLERIDWQPR